jgi:nitric oxide reductase subunit B
MQLRDVLNNGYWHARNISYLNQSFVRLIEWARMPGDIVFIVLGVVPAVVASVIVYMQLKQADKTRGIPQ